jgi:cation transport protein ChaC
MRDADPHPIPPIDPIPALPPERIREEARAWVASLINPENTWIFGTGSLLWNPGFRFVERRKARVDGWRRALCLYSLTFRGTPERPGLVMGLAPGGCCEGSAFRLDPDHIDDAALALWEREMSHDSYLMVTLEAETDQGPVPCYSFTPRDGHPQCAHGLPPETIADVVRRASGLRGTNIEYVLNTVEHLDEMGIHDPDLHALADRLRDKTDPKPTKDRSD